ncbi:MAG: hypothetical protein V3W31_10470 [Thermodesulfobacteriota bacterium]
MKVFLLSSAIVLFAGLALPPTARGAEPPEEERAVRVIKIKGSLEKPRTLFIVPKARLWDDDIPNKRFIDEVLEPLYPESARPESARPESARKREITEPDNN